MLLNASKNKSVVELLIVNSVQLLPSYLPFTSLGNGQQQVPVLQPWILMASASLVRGWLGLEG